MSDMQQNFDEQLAVKEDEMSSRLDHMNQKRETELSGVLMHFSVLLLSFSCLILIHSAGLLIIVEQKYKKVIGFSFSCKTMAHILYILCQWLLFTESKLLESSNV